MMTDPFKPIREFAWREEVDRFLDETGRETWRRVDEFSDHIVDEVCLVSDRGELLIVPERGKRRLMGNAKLYASYTAFRDEYRRMEEEVEVPHPLEVGFKPYRDHPADIAQLAHRCAELVGATFSGSWASLLPKADRWVGWQYSIDGADRLYRDSDSICMLCALAGEAIRERLGVPLAWTVRVENSLGTGGKDLHAADLMAVDGRICQVSIPLIGQIADPDHSPPSRIIRTFVDFQLRHPFLG